jgi:hypothetical protein
MRAIERMDMQIRPHNYTLILGTSFTAHLNMNSLFIRTFIRELLLEIFIF